ncbi:MAG: hypothetical protein LBQ54_16355 [Planctomycetaceae bacterium]|jgi:hypothetical protein|nr:hypothetical protein [Planctomycetaceae bacterium]
MKNRKFFIGVLLTLCLMLSGCRPQGIPTVPIEIIVTYKGKNVEGALVTLAPTVKDGTQRTATGMTDSAGKAAITTPAGGTGAMEGDFKVTVMKTPLIGGGNQEETPSFATYEEAVAHASTKTAMGTTNPGHQLPVRYASEKTTDLKISVRKGEKNRWAFELTD